MSFKLSPWRLNPGRNLPMASRTVLISGAGIAGCTVAYWMARNGWSVTVMERGASLRTSGSPVDVRGAAAHIAERMNIASQLRDARIRLDGLTLLDSAGRRGARVDIGTMRSLLRRCLFVPP
jgi:2-polyprenyl-6-methoxyphenol hydroxylase-like FAD-dependent oxidoreductase